MTLNNAAWAIDGALSSAALARTGLYASLPGGTEGIVSRTDLKVTQLATPGNGLLISGGAAVVLNRYQTTPNQSYVIVNDGTHTVASSSMPAAVGTEQTYIVAIAVGDKEFSNAGHPFMLATDPPVGEEATFAYVRPVVVLESAFNSRAYPAIPLARLVVPASTTTFTTAMITDIRTLANPHSKLEIANVVGPGADNPLNGGGGTPGTYERFPNVPVVSVTVPSWAKTAKIMGFVEGLKLTKAGDGKLRAYVEGTSLNTPVTNVDENAAGSGNERRAYNFGGEIDVSSVAGTSKVFSLQGTPNATADKGALVADGQTSVAMQVYFEEKPV